MSRPTEPIVWDDGTPDYPAGADPWAATRTANIPAYTYFTPGIPVPAQEVNYLLNSMSQSLKDLTDYIGQVQAQNFYHHSLLGSTDAITCPPQSVDISFNSESGPGGWIIPTISNAKTGGGLWQNAKVFRCSDDGENWVSLAHPDAAAAGFFISAMACNPADGSVLTAMREVANTRSHYRFYSAGSWAAATANISKYFDEGFFFNSLYVMIGAPSSTGQAGAIQTSPDGAAFTTRTVTGTNTAWDSVTSWTSAANSSKIISLARVHNASGLGYTVSPAQQSADGTTWTYMVGPGTQNTGVQALCWNASRSRFLAASPDGTQTIFYDSPDGVTWTTLNGGVGLPVAYGYVTGLVALGSMYVATTVQAGSSAGEGGVKRLLCSVDGGITWRLIRYRFPTYGIVNDIAVSDQKPYLRPSLAYARGQLALLDTSDIRLGMRAGLPPIAT